MKQIKKRYYVLISLVLIIFFVLFFLSTFIKNYVNNNSQELIGRKVELGNLNINYFRVAVRATNLRVYEANQTDTFAGFKELYVNFDPTKLFGNEYSFSTITLDSLFVNVIQDENGFNFDDLIPAEDSTQVAETDTIPSKPFRFSIHDIKLLHGNVHFNDKLVDNVINLDDVSLDLPLIAWDSESSDVGIEFEFGQQGKVFVGAHVDQLKNEYNVDFKVDNLGLKAISSYVENAIDAGGIEGYFNTDLNIKGSIENTTDVIVKGQASVVNFRLWDLEDNDVFSLQELNVGMEAMDVGQQKFDFSHVRVNNPIITASLYKDMSNIERMLLPVMSSDSITAEDAPADSLASDSLQLQYLVKSFSIKDGEIIFTDNTLYRPFLYDFKAINVDLKNISQDAEQVPLTFSINMNDQGEFTGESTLNMVNPAVFDLKAKLNKLRLMSFSPYTEYHIARPITQGRFNYDLSINMTPTHMTNNNNIVINELEIGNKTKNEPQVKAPVKLGLYLMKDPKDRITIDLPVEGNPSDPDFSVSKLVWKAFSNLLIKVAASPFNALGNLVGSRPEELENLPMPYSQDSLSIDQRKTLDKIASILEKKPELIFSFVQQTDPVIEKDVMAIQMTKKQMLSESMPMNNERQIANFNQRLGEMEDTNPELMAYVSTKVPASEGMSLNKACRQLIGEDELDDAFNKLLINRNELINYYLNEEKGIDSTSFEVSTADLRNLPEELKSCNYKVEVSIK